MAKDSDEEKGPGVGQRLRQKGMAFRKTGDVDAKLVQPVALADSPRGAR